jgi:predicted MPP superfamily phosphohydrolase
MTNNKPMSPMSLGFKHLRIASISDIHLLHKNNKTAFIIKNLDTYLNTDELLSKVDILFIAGDLFDGSVSFSNEDIGIVNIWIAKLLYRCKKYNVCLRVLEGTPSHDMGQSKIFTTLNEILFKGEGVDLEYVKNLSIEYIERFGIHVLYVPDEWNHDNHDTLLEVKTLMKNKGLTQVDFAVMHGQFEYQLQDVVKQHVKHDSVEYLNLVKYLIFIGHIHKYSSKDRIFSHGSFDRLAHNEEEAKGFIYATVYKDGQYECKFIENKGARIYKTVKCVSEDTELNMKRIDKVAAKLPDESFIRIMASGTNPIMSAQEVLKKRWPNLFWSFTKDKEKDKRDLTASYKNTQKYTPIIINKESVRNLLLPKLHTLQLSSAVIGRCLSHISDIERLS